MTVPNVIIMDDKVAHLRHSCDEDIYYEASLNKYKLGIYCARYVQNPLRETASLVDNFFNIEDSTLFQLVLNTYQDSIPKDYLVKEAIKRLCIESTKACVFIQECMKYTDGYGTFYPSLKSPSPSPSLKSPSPSPSQSSL